MFIVLDAIDGAGKGAQRIEISNLLAQKGIHVQSEEFPVHNVFYESVVHPALQELTTLNKASWVLSFLLDKTMQADKILPFVGSPDKHFIADGYFTTTIAYQSFLSGQVSLDKLLTYSEDFEIPKPDLAIFLDVDPEVAMSRKEKEEGHDEGLDMNEKSLDKQKKLQTIFTKMYTEQIYCKWEKVDGNGTIPEVSNGIMQIIEQFLVQKSN